MISASFALDELAERYWAFRCDEFPIGAILAGVEPAGDRLTRDAPDDYDRRVAWAAEAMEELDVIMTDGLSQTDRSTHMLLRGELAAIVDSVVQQAHLRPSIYPLGPEFLLATWASMTSLATVQDARRYIDRLATVGDSLADVQRCLSKGRERGLRYPRLVVERAIEVVTKGHASIAIEANPFFGPLKPLAARGAAFGELIDEGRAIIANSVAPAFADYVQFLRDILLPAARDDLACTGDIDGEGHYRFLIRQFTTIDMAPGDIHSLGLAEVGRITAEMEKVAAQAGFEGELGEFKRRLQTDNSQVLESGEALREAVEILSKRIDARIPEFFGRIPRATYGVKSIPEAIAAAMPPAYAQPNPADNSAAGVHWITSIPAKLPRYMHLPIALHEAWPGHLMHLALIQELTDLPAFRRHGAMNYSACLEGWALYSEGLGEDMGLYDTPEKRYGRLEMEMWRAVRLVVDTGLHLKGWSRSQAIDYFRAHMAMPVETIEAEVDRYVGLPGQALGYQLGNLKFRELRSRAEAALGARFDIRAFNDALASAGAVSLTVLDQTIETWLELRSKDDVAAA
jgi:uncharacterized protein (DUF885 family)